MSSFKNNVESYSLLYILTIPVWKSYFWTNVLPLTFKNSSRHQKMSKNMLVLPNQSCIEWLERIKQTGDGITWQTSKLNSSIYARMHIPDMLCCKLWVYPESHPNKHLSPSNKHLLPECKQEPRLATHRRWWNHFHADGSSVGRQGQAPDGHSTWAGVRTTYVIFSVSSLDRISTSMSVL